MRTPATFDEQVVGQPSQEPIVASCPAVVVSLA